MNLNLDLNRNLGVGLVLNMDMNLDSVLGPGSTKSAHYDLFRLSNIQLIK